MFGGLEALRHAVAQTGAKVLLITMPSAPGPAVRRVTEMAMGLGLEVRTVPPVHELLDGSIDAFRVRRVRVEDLIRRPEVTKLGPEVEAIIHDRVVFVTGAGGSIGSELARQVHAMGPRRLVLVDRAESALYSIQRELEVRAMAGRGSGEVDIRLANVASRAVMRRLVEGSQPHVIFHAAAYKHVPLMEAHPSDAVQVNIGGTLAVLDAAAGAGTPHVVLVSSDKAVAPSSVMGATKRVAEWLVGEAARLTGRAYVSVRFGNVLGSTGSVVPIFQNQLENAEPLTVTHPEMTRYFMTIAEASSLILEAAALGRPGDLFVLDMGEPVRIVDLARDLARLAGRDPDTVPIVFTGLRPGEKLHEQLYYDNELVRPTPNAKVMLATGDPRPMDAQRLAREMLELADGEHDDLLRERLSAIVGRSVGDCPLRTFVPAEGVEIRRRGSHAAGAGQVRGLSPAGRSGGRRAAICSRVVRIECRTGPDVPEQRGTPGSPLRHRLATSPDCCLQDRIHATTAPEVRALPWLARSYGYQRSASKAQVEEWLLALGRNRHRPLRRGHDGRACLDGRDHRADRHQRRAVAGRSGRDVGLYDWRRGFKGTLGTPDRDGLDQRTS